MTLLSEPTGTEHEWALNHSRDLVAAATLEMTDYDRGTAVHGAHVGYAAQEAAQAIVSQLIDFNRRNASPAHYGNTRQSARVTKKYTSIWQFPEDDIEVIGVAGAIHDYAKLHIPQYMLNPEIEFTSYMHSVLATHPVEGFNMIDNRMSSNTSGLESWHHRGIIASAVLLHHLLQARPYPAPQAIEKLLKNSANFSDHTLESLLSFAPHTLLVIGADKADAMARAYRANKQGQQALLSRLVRGIVESDSPHTSLFEEYFSDELILGLRTIANFQNTLNPPVELQLVDKELEQPELGIFSR